MNSAGFWRFATIGTICTATVLIAAIWQLGLVSSATQIHGNDLTQVKVVRETQTVTTQSGIYVGVPGASTKITVPAGQQALIIVRFAAASRCTGAGNINCNIRVIVGGAEISPAGSSVDVFDNTSVSGGFSSHHALERSIVKGPGTYNVRVQYRVGSAFNASFALGGFHMTVERIIQ
jgi:hypothetical protein